jgi:hypothetical protein
MTPHDLWVVARRPADAFNSPGENDRDRLVNQQVFACGLAPANVTGFRAILVRPDKNTGHFTYQRRVATGLAWQIGTSTKVLNWHEDVTAGQTASPVDGHGKPFLSGHSHRAQACD